MYNWMCVHKHTTETLLDVSVPKGFMCVKVMWVVQKYHLRVWVWMMDWLYKYMWCVKWERGESRMEERWMLWKQCWQGQNPWGGFSSTFGSQRGWAQLEALFSPQGVVHTVGGYMLYVATTFKYVFDFHAEDVFWCTADIGWITGHSYVTYGPLANGATSVLVRRVLGPMATWFI